VCYLIVFGRKEKKSVFWGRLFFGWFFCGSLCKFDGRFPAFFVKVSKWIAFFDEKCCRIIWNDALGCFEKIIISLEV
jgi:hypothetical protein